MKKTNGSSTAHEVRSLVERYNRMAATIGITLPEFVF